MKWTALYLLGFVILIGGILAALWNTEVLASIGAYWTDVGLDITMGLAIMFAVANSGMKENIQIDRDDCDIPVTCPL